jgi:hypothetical protein
MAVMFAAACRDGNAAEGNGSGGVRAQVVARQFATDCEAGEAPNEVMRRHLNRLCTCTTDRIAATSIGLTESGESIDRKVQAAMQYCIEEVGGAPGEGREAKTKK